MRIFTDKNLLCLLLKIWGRREGPQYISIWALRAVIPKCFLTMFSSPPQWFSRHLCRCLRLLSLINGPRDKYYIWEQSLEALEWKSETGKWRKPVKTGSLDRLLLWAAEFHSSLTVWRWYRTSLGVVPPEGQGCCSIGPIGQWLSVFLDVQLLGIHG